MSAKSNCFYHIVPLIFKQLIIENSLKEKLISKKLKE